MIDKNAAFEALNKVTLPKVHEYLQNGIVVVLIGAICSGKSNLAGKALPSATLVTGDNGLYKASQNMDSDLIGEELFGHILPDELIRSRDQVLALGHQVIITGQIWQHVLPYLAGLSINQYRVFDLDSVWEAHGRAHRRLDKIPDSVLVN